jgi:hypothetical protein
VPCDTKIRVGQQIDQRRREIQTAVDRLEAALGAGTAKVVVGPTGAVAFAGWTDKNDVTDLCAFRRLTAKGSWALRQAVAKAQGIAGRTIDQRQVAAGVHSHDGGQTFSPGHKK